VTPVSAATNTAGQPIEVGAGVTAIAITPNGRTAYVVNYGSYPDDEGTVTPIQTATGTAGKTIKVGNEPEVIVITP
jgi:DNA-binding beta-propeller fold protein YncE